jgi:hypothetical protein
MNRLIKTAAIAAFGWACYKIGDIKGSFITAMLSLADKEEEKEAIGDLARHKHAPFWLNAVCATALRKTKEEFSTEPDTDAPEEAD